ncbi:MAG: mannose-1-phosphate guanylyltransferase/mannose-6-phosphate isomerase [Burkholderiaceae bacterium]
MSAAHRITPVILCGGAGTRLWPLSRAGFPKQFLVLTGNQSLFQQAIQRLTTLSAADIVVDAPLIVTSDEQRFLALDQLRELKNTPARLLLEPVGRNTAPALTLAALHANANDDDPILVVSPADQTIAHEPPFTQALQQAVRAAAQGGIVVLGIPADRPETGYGYIRQSGPAGAHGEHAVASFTEKPDAATAQTYVESGEYTWNSGLFVLRASVWLAALERFRPDIAQACTLAWAARTNDAPFIRPDRAAFTAVPADSIDYAVMEHCAGTDIAVRMVPLVAGWSDLGAWDAVWAVNTPDVQGNVTRGDTMTTDTTNSLIHATSRLVGTVGVDHLVIVETADAVLVADRRHSQDVKKLVAALDRAARPELALHRTEHRPWGWSDSIDEAERFKVKHILVKPQASLSLQKHHHRAEHWIVVRGTAEVTCGDKTLLLTENQSTYIPLGETHRLRNPGHIPLELIEVQSGSYLGEDDIVRFEDTYGRTL